MLVSQMDDSSTFSSFLDGGLVTVGLGFLKPLQIKPFTSNSPGVGLEPTTLPLTAGCSTVELPGNQIGVLIDVLMRRYDII